MSITISGLTLLLGLVKYEIWIDVTSRDLIIAAVQIKHILMHLGMFEIDYPLPCYTILKSSIRPQNKLFVTGCTNEDEVCYSIFTSEIPRIIASITNYEFIDPSPM